MKHLLPGSLILLVLSSCGINNAITTEEQSSETGYSGVTTFICGLESNPLNRFFFPVNKNTGEVYEVDSSNSKRTLINKEFLSETFGKEYTTITHFVSYRKGSEHIFEFRAGVKNLPSDKNTISSRKQLFNFNTLTASVEQQLVRGDYKINADGSLALDTKKETFKCAAMPLPFSPSTKDFQNFLNSNNVDWGSGKKVEFKHLDNCSESANAGSMYRIFSCKEGYVSVTSPLGKKVCELDKSKGVVAKTTISSDMKLKREYEYNYDECSVQQG